MDIIIVILILLFGFTLKSRYKILSSYEHIILDQLFFYHMIMSFIFYIYIRANGGDAIHYWSSIKGVKFEDLWAQVMINSGPGAFLGLLNYIPSNLLDLNLFTGCMLYGMFGYWGIVLLIVNIKEEMSLVRYLKNYKVLNFSIFPAILYLPNFHFWSAGVGKDTILFFCVSAFIYAIKNIKQRWVWLLVAILPAYTIRPHILLFLVAGFGASYILKSKLFAFQKVIIIILGLVAFMPLLSSVLEFTKIEQANLESFTKFSEHKAGALSHAGSGIELSNLPYPVQVFTFLYRPLFFDAPNVLGLLASVENVIWLVLSFIFFKNQPFRVFKKSSMIVLGAFLYWIIGALAFAPVMGNLGIIVRERNMFLPAFIVFAVAGLYNTKKFKKFQWYYNQKKTNYLVATKVEKQPL